MKEDALHLTTGGKQENRRALDYYPTPKEVTEALLLFLKWEPCVVWEPAAGDGRMSSVLRQYGHTVVESDINTGTDYLTAVAPDRVDAIITNPPFKLSEGFIRKAVTESDRVAFLLKTQYWHSKKRLPLFKTHTPAYILPLTWRPDFIDGERGGSPTMDVIWTVWLRGANRTEYVPLEKPDGVKK